MAIDRAAGAPGPALVQRVMRTLAREITGLELPAVEKISQDQAEDPFQILIATLLSARTQDATTHAASERLFRKARTPRTMAALPVGTIERLIYPVSFYRHKARHVKACCRRLVTEFAGRVPDSMAELVTLPGVGRKTANLVMILAFRSRRNICVDTHVHRIANRLGWVATRTPDETEQALYRATHPTWWPSINLYLVTWGQNVCRPRYPRCGDCALRHECPRIGVDREGQRSRPPRSGERDHDARMLDVDDRAAPDARGRRPSRAGRRAAVSRSRTRSRGGNRQGHD